MRQLTSMIRKGKCQRAGCAHDLAICDDPLASCPAAGWGPEGEYPSIIPSLGRMAMNYALAAGRDFMAGRPRRSEEEVARITGICESCENFRHTDRRCGLCLCPVGDKIPMAMESCPIGKW